MKILKMQIVGNGSILMHNPEKLMGSDDATSMKKNKRPPEEEARLGLYALPNEQLYIKSDSFREAAIQAAKTRRDNARKGRASMQQAFMSSVFLAEEHCLLERKNGKPITSARKDWELDVRRVVLKPAGGIMRARPKITDWQCTLTYEYEERGIEPEEILVIQAVGGMFPGILDYRVGKKGSFGRYFVKDLATGKIVEATTRGDVVEEEVEEAA
jgi:hypothetical protein